MNKLLTDTVKRAFIANPGHHRWSFKTHPGPPNNLESTHSPFLALWRCLVFVLVLTKGWRRAARCGRVLEISSYVELLTRRVEPPTLRREAPWNSASTGTRSVEPPTLRLLQAPWTSTSTGTR